MALSTSQQQDQDRSEVPTQTTTNTLLGNLINKACVTNQKIDIPEFTTLNEVYGIRASESIGVKNGRDFELKYFTLGVRGADSVGKDANGVDVRRTNQHQPIDGNVFVPIPLCIRPLSNPLDNLTRAKYRGREVKTLNGVAYEIYWVGLTKFDRYDPQLLKIYKDPVSGTEDVKKYIPSSDDLRPTPVELTSSNTVPISNTYVNGSAILNCTLSESELEELKNACRIYYNDAGYAAPNEIAMVYGIDSTVDGDIGGGKYIRYTEALSMVVGHYITERSAREANNNREISLLFDHGGSEPMLLHTTSSTTANASTNP
ncbi:hypothetical protein NFI00_000056 [Salmonella enterica]|nr:hypothetical protein [Salmonella enterica subsp. enterica serovar Minnesota]EJI5696353.1 hypothetical protein [Salmonella enterica]